MNELTQNKHPELFTIPDAYLYQFEQQIISSYMKRMENQIFFANHLPIIDEDLLFQDAINLEMYVTAYHMFVFQKPDFVDKLKERFASEEVHEMMQDFRWEIERNLNFSFDYHLYKDVKAVLDFHYMSFIDITDGMVEKELHAKTECGFLYRNLPLMEVW